VYRHMYTHTRMKACTCTLLGRVPNASQTPELNHPLLHPPPLPPTPPTPPTTSHRAVQGYLAGTGMAFKAGEALMETWTGKEGEAVNSAFGAFWVVDEWTGLGGSVGG
jgi:hypothetical protein